MNGKIETCTSEPKVVKYQEMFGQFTRKNGCVFCEFVYPNSLYCNDNGYTYYSVELNTYESEEKIIKRFYQAIKSKEPSEFETVGYSCVYNTLEILCKDCGIPIERIIG